MRHGLYGGIALLAAAVLGGPPARAADPLSGPNPAADDRFVARGQIGPLGEAYGNGGDAGGGYSVPGQPSELIPIPTGNPGGHGFYTFAEFVYLTQTWTMGDQTVAYRGLVDATGAVTGVPGTYVGSGATGLTTDVFGRSSYLPGVNLGIGYKTDDGVSVYGSYMYTQRQTYNAAATIAAPFFRSRQDLSDTFLVAGVYNFPPQYAGPRFKTQEEANLNANVFYGVWNGASDMVITYSTHFNQGEIGGRVPLFQTEYSRIYGLAGGRFDWFFERFEWRTISYDHLGATGPRDAATYQNTLSQRMYGPFIGCGHEVYMGKRFSLSLDLTAAGLLNIAKERAKYELDDNSIQNKRSINDYTVVPSVTGNLNLWWYPTEGIQLRLGYNAWTFFNTKNMRNPIGFNYGAIDPVYDTQFFRLVHGFNAGFGIFF